MISSGVMVMPEGEDPLEKLLLDESELSLEFEEPELWLDPDVSEELLRELDEMPETEEELLLLEAELFEFELCEELLEELLELDEELLEFDEELLERDDEPLDIEDELLELIDELLDDPELEPVEGDEWELSELPLCDELESQG
jgi:hypothetical protein